MKGRQDWIGRIVIDDHMRAALVHHRDRQPLLDASREFVLCQHGWKLTGDGLTGLDDALLVRCVVGSICCFDPKTSDGVSIEKSGDLDLFAQAAPAILAAWEARKQGLRRGRR